ncbi:DWNN ubiquitin-like domain-containing protein [Ordospora colligata]|uniref:DWNN ubiquitin-like domain-containing protein n=1 Tax=Ordospora colligata OC4 TaxID=1354746 RepID=A0A0B2UFJ6_9MICR|nr:DWNN ubiquitin-like domain-containing protein [Ordospora colligata OC4]KHN69841.1 DWNN ubiquitin-like domain-containing protein [Ordospora colligata OC4]TBU16011.1 DWNN ubiquitin-like domain-containing protein [Ordospora colligata]TBU16224.1 DWNN ubiquitin-like domain-containing protein [Ordospora colligata]TBU18928.1 DWNN ubiquitin-like domain-containing protein [Ordospora colligata]
MTSVINYRFRSNKNFSRISFQGTGLPLWELKYEIINQRKMVSKDFDLLFFDCDTCEEVNDEYHVITMNSHVIVDRIPLWMSKGGYNVKEKRTEPQGQHHNVHKYNKAIPESYVCFRCGQKGHYIQNCHTNQDKAFDILRIRKPSGIPKDFLVPVSGEGASSNTAMLVTSEGGYVKAQPQTQEWKKYKQHTKPMVGIPERLKCPSCHCLLTNPMKTNCGHVLCDQCVIVDRRCYVCGQQVKNFSLDAHVKAEVERAMNQRF